MSTIIANPILTVEGSKKRAWIKYDAMEIRANGDVSLLRKGKEVAFFELGKIEEGDVITITDLHGMFRLED